MSRAEALKVKQFDEAEWRKTNYKHRLRQANTISNNTSEDDWKPSNIYKRVNHEKK